MSIRKIAAGISGLMAVSVCSLANAATLVNYKPTPISPTIPEFVFGGAGPSLGSGPGAIGNNDGVLPLIAQTPGGLEAESPFVLVAPGSVPSGGGSTIFYDTSLLLNGLAASAPAINAGGTLIQSLGAGGFQLLSTNPGGGSVLLLSGTISSASIVGANGGGAGAVFSASGVTYTGGAIFAAMLAANGNPNNNDMSISMTDVIPGFGINGGTGFLNNFSANATGLFSFQFVPEPGTLSLVGVCAAALIRRRRSA